MAISSNLAKFRKNGYTIDYTPGSATPAGSIVKVGGLLALPFGTLPRTKPRP